MIPLSQIEKSGHSEKKGTSLKKVGSLITLKKTGRHFKGTGHFFETLSVGSVPGTDHS